MTIDESREFADHGALIVPVLALRAASRVLREGADEVERAAHSLPSRVGAGAEVDAAVHACALAISGKVTTEVARRLRLADGLDAAVGDLVDADASAHRSFGTLPRRQ